MSTRQFSTKVITLFLVNGLLISPVLLARNNQISKGRGNGYAQARWNSRGQGAGQRLQNGSCAFTANVSLTEQEIEHIQFLREEEKLARDVYVTLYEKWNVISFNNISQSEQRHMDAIYRLIQAYQLDDPVKDNSIGVFTNEELAELYEELVEKGSESLLESLKVGALIEEKDIYDLQQALSETKNEQIIRVFENLLRGSRNHLRAYARQINLNGGTYEAQYLTQEEFDQIANSSPERGNGKRGNGFQRGRQGQGNGYSRGFRNNQNTRNQPSYNRSFMQ